MKAIVCELCGGNELKKEGGVYVCQHCGTQYTPEETKKLFVEVSVSGNVQVDGIATTDTLIRKARNFRKRQDYERAEEAYDRVLDTDPDNREAVEFVSLFCGKAKRANLVVEVSGKDDDIVVYRHDRKRSDGDNQDDVITVKLGTASPRSPLKLKMKPGRIFMDISGYWKGYVDIPNYVDRVRVRAELSGGFIMKSANVEITTEVDPTFGK